MATDVRELPGARRVTQGTRLLAGLYVWLVGWLVLWVALPALVLPWSPLVITSGSMAPAINRGDVVLVTSSGLDEVTAGQVVTFHRDGDPDEGLITHRIFAVDGDGRFITQGDANSTPDSTPIGRDALVGQGTLLVPYVGLPLLWLRESPAFFVAWLVLTTIAVSLARAGVPKIEQLVDEQGEPLFDVGAGWWRRVDRVLGLLEGKPRPAPGPVRAWAPTVAAALACGLVARSPVAVLLSVLAVVGVLLADPRGPHLPVGRLAASVGRRRNALGDRMLPRVREQGAMMMLPGVAILTLGLMTGPSEGAFVAAAVPTGSQVGSGIWDCAAPGVLADGWIGEVDPAASNDTATVLLVDGDLPRARALVAADPVSPAGCTASVAELLLPVQTVTSGAVLEIRAITSSFDVTTSSWNSPPTVGTDTVVVAAALGVVRVDVTALLAAAPVGFEIRVQGEDTDVDLDDGTPGSVGIQSLEGGTGPSLEIQWVQP